MASLPDPLEAFLRDSLRFFPRFNGSLSKKKKGEAFSLDSYLASALDSLVQNLVMFDRDCRRIRINGRKRGDFSGVLSNLRFARIGGKWDENVGERKFWSSDDSVESLKDCTAELAELLPRPSGEKEFKQYMETKGKQLFEELDRDKAGQVSLEDLEVAMSKRIPKRYAWEVLHCSRGHFLSKSIGLKQFLSLMEQKEMAILHAYITLCSSKSGIPKENQFTASLRIAGVPECEDNTVALMHYLNANDGESISYSKFRSFMLLLPLEHREGDPWNKWCEAGSAVPISQPAVPLAQNVLKSALAGGIACSFSAFVMHPVDTIKTVVQASTLSFPELISKLPEVGLRGLYKGSIPTVLGQFSSHGLRTGLCEASKFVLRSAIPALPDIQVESLASFISAILGTASRIPCEVLKQRLQAGIFDDVGEAALVTWRQDGMKGFFRGTGATLCREVPFYVLGMGLYEETKKGIQKLVCRELEPWETVLVGAVTGGLASVLTTPFDVIKTRMMTAPQGLEVTMQMAAVTILREEGLPALFRGALPRFFWVAPLGAMNFAGYELLRKAMDRRKFLSGNQQSEKRIADAS